MQLPKHSLHRPSRVAIPASLQLERWQRRAIYLSVLLLTLSGAVWLAAHYFFRPVGQFGETVSPLEPWSMKLHGAAAIALFFLLGSILNGHIRRALRSQRNRLSGWSMVGLLSALTLSGYGLYYLASEPTRPLWSFMHWIPGCALIALLVSHVFVGRRSRA